MENMENWVMATVPPKNTPKSYKGHCSVKYVFKIFIGYKKKKISIYLFIYFIFARLLLVHLQATDTVLLWLMMESFIPGEKEILADLVHILVLTYLVFTFPEWFLLYGQ